MMSVCLSLCLLVAALQLSSAVQTEECPQILEPLPRDDIKVLGRWNVILGYTDHPVFSTIMNLTESSWVNIKEAGDNTTDFQMTQDNKINHICVAQTTNLKFEGNVFHQKVGTMSSSFVLLPSCDGCATLSVNTSVIDAERMLRPFNVSVSDTEMSVRSLYLMARNTSVEAAGLEGFHQQAACMGFTQPPIFSYDPASGFCAQGEGVVLFNQEVETN